MEKNNYSFFLKALFVLAALFFSNQINAQQTVVLLDNCDELGEAPNNWRGISDNIIINTTDQKEGKGCLETTGSAGADKFSKVFETPIDITNGGTIDEEDGVLKFWLYVSDPSLMNAAGGQIELGSAGRPDVAEWNWPFNKSDIQQGWHEYSFNFSNHGGDANMNTKAVNWFRIYKHVTTSDPEAANAIVYRLDNVRVESKSIIKVKDYSVSLEDENKVRISWNEVKDAYGRYEIEHSTNGRDFTFLARINRIILRQSSIHYQYDDDNPKEGINYYRLVFVPEEGEKIIIGTQYVVTSNNNNAQSIIGKVITGYQGWFYCYGDGSTIARWAHWSGGRYQSNDGYPAPGHLSFEIYPDISEYKETSLFQTGFANKADGTPAKLFSSFKEDVIDKHFEWMKTYGIDGAALQRFLGETRDGVFKTARDSVAVRMKRAAEKHDRIFYMMYDMDANDPAYFKRDWEHMENDLKITQSTAYAHQDGKPVICIWGFGFTHRSDKVENSLEIINWLKDKGYYVIGGVPRSWRNSSGDSHPGYTEVYKAFDMISPWTVGRFGDNNGADNHKREYLLSDVEYCQENGIDYQPVIFSGFAWSNWNSNKVNEMPRNRGEFLWRQFYNVRTSGIPNLYIAMFDEYDEGTNIMKAADSYFDIPTDQYFLTYSADGTYISSDFYLRMAGKAARALKGIEPLTENVSIPYSEGPVWFRTSVEKGFDAVFHSSAGIVRSENVQNLECVIEETEQSHIGKHAIKFSGESNANEVAFADFMVFDVDIPINAKTKLGYWSKPLNENGKYISLSLLMSDGTKVVWSTINMETQVPVGNINEWGSHLLKIGEELEGRTIDKIYITFEKAPKSGEFSAYIDDIVITDTDQPIITSIKSIFDTTASNRTDAIGIYPTYITDNKININALNVDSNNQLTLGIANLQGSVLLKRTIPARMVNELQLDLPRGVYIISVTGSGVSSHKKIIIE